MIERPLSTEAFAPFGTVLTGPFGDPTAADPTFTYWSDLLRFTVEGEIEVGVCTAHARGAGPVAWMERHARTAELLIPTDTPFLLPVMDAAGAVSVFEVRPGQAVLIARGVWHGACAPAGGRKASTYYVVFRRGTPEDDVEKIVPGVAESRP